jgi:hypothetical protein
MVKTIIKSNFLRQAKQKRMRGKKSKNEINKKKNSKTYKKDKNLKKNPIKISLDINYYLKERINFLFLEVTTNINKLLATEKNELNETYLNKPKYKQENRVLVLIGLKDIITQIIQQNPHLVFPDNFIFSVIALFDFYLDKSTKELKRVDMVRALYSCLDLIDKEQNIGIFSNSYFEKYVNYDMEIEIFETVDLNFYPVKLFDYFDIFYFKITQIKKNDKKFLDYFEEFKKKFLDLAFYMVFHEHSKKLKPSNNFVSCLIHAYESTLPINQNFNELNDFINQFDYSEEDYSNSNIMIEESISVYNQMLKNIHEKNQMSHKE